MNRFRYWLFRKISFVGWVICPEPQRTFWRKELGISHWTATYERVPSARTNEQRERVGT